MILMRVTDAPCGVIHQPKRRAAVGGFYGQVTSGMVALILKLASGLRQLLMTAATLSVGNILILKLSPIPPPVTGEGSGSTSNSVEKLSAGRTQLRPFRLQAGNHRVLIRD
jgi:hypothetical protein